MLSLFRSGGLTIPNIILWVLSTAVVVFLTLPIHEFAHAFAANKLGDPTARYQGRLTINPLAHIDYIGALAILVFGFGWAKPVPINMRNFKNPKVGMAISALAGPLSNLICAFVALLFYNGMILLFIKTQIQILIYVIYFFSFVAQINISLAVFNLIPIPPLDGSRLLNVILPDRIYYSIMQYEQFLMIAVLVLVNVGLLNGPLAVLNQGVMNGLNTIAALPFNFFR